MAVGVTQDFESLQLADYDAVCEALNFPAEWPDGLLAHGSVEVDGKLRVTSGSPGPNSISSSPIATEPR
jgi:hypothetical protein